MPFIKSQFAILPLTAELPGGGTPDVDHIESENTANDSDNLDTTSINGESETDTGYVLDTTVRQIELIGGKTTTVEWKNTALGLAANEYVTESRLVFGEVKPGFHETTGPKVQVRVLDTVENGQKFTNKTDVGGKYIKVWVYDTDGWLTVAYNKPKGDLPKTGQ